MSLDDDIAKLAEQEQRLQFERFGAADAWALGSALKALAEARGQAVTIEIRVARELVFFHAMPGTVPSNADWARRKRNACELLGRSSYRIGRELEKGGATLEAKMGLATRDYAAHGGAFPLQVRGMGPVGTVTVSGLPQRADHALIVEVLAGFCRLPHDELALPD
ncbi:MAG: heme-degrading domain-containing protein [Piscinibacter sp.]|nr:heme-degrading domain-containing protein [Piscinibacter sp.]